jgi:UDP-2,3-diacylglucosamine pyrophosphatase LpxH
MISLEDTAANWYSRLMLGCIYSWQQLKEKFLLNFQGFQAELDTEKDFLSCAQREKETLPDFYKRFQQLKAQAPEVSDDQVIAQAIKALCAGPLHSHIVREWPKTMPELYEQFTKFSKYEVQHFHKLEQQRKISKPEEASRPRYNENQ